MIARNFQRLPLRYNRNGTSLTQINFVVHLHGSPVRDLAPRLSLIKIKKENLLLSKRSLSTCASNISNRCTTSTQHRDIFGNSGYCWSSGTFARTSFPKSATAITVSSHRQYSSVAETVRENIAPTYAGYFKMFYDTPPVEFVQNTILYLHSYTGLPWWATIVLTALTIRMTVTLPLSVYQQYIQAKLQNLRYDMDPIAHKVRKEIDYGINHLQWTSAYAKSYYARSMKREWRRLVVEENCHPMKSVIISLMQLPLYVIPTIATMNMCYMLPQPTELAYRTLQELTTGGFGWVSNLVVPDPYFLIPIASAMISLSVIEIRYQLNGKKTAAQKYLTYFARTCTLVILPITSFLPSGVYLLWLTSSTYVLFETLLLLSPRFRRFTGIPETDADLDHPYATLRELLKERFKLKKSASAPSQL